MFLLDTNAILRFILNDVPKQNKLIVEFIQSNPAAIRLEVFVEVVYVLEKYYKKSRPEIAKIIAVLGRTENLLIQYPHIVERSLHLFIEENLDIVDCILCSFNNLEGYGVFTFDKKLNSLLQTWK